MEKRVIWCWLQLKLQLKKPVHWIQLLAMGILVWVITAVTLPDNENMQVLLCNEAGAFGEEFVQQLKDCKSLFLFREVKDADTLRQEVLAGRAECGFVLKKGLEEKLIRERPQQLIQFFCPDASTKEAVVRETVFRELFAYSSNMLLEQTSAAAFSGKDKEKAIAFARERNAYYQNSDEVFDVIYETVDVEENREQQRGAQPVRGMIAAVIFLNMLLMKGEDISGQSGGYAQGLSKAEKRSFFFWRYMSGSVILGAAGITMLKVLGMQENIFYELLKMMIFFAVSGIWVNIAGSLLKRETVYFGWICPLLALNLVLPPVFWDLASYVPAIGRINRLLPVGIYLELF